MCIRDSARTVASTASRPSTPQDVNALPISNEPGYVSDSKTEQNNPEVATLVEESTNKKSKCNKDHEYVVMIDAGSTGSRVHVYEFDVCSQPPALINESFKMLKPGLSSFDTDAEGAAKSLDPLLQVALDAVPEKKRSCTPVAVKATAGLRLLGDTKSAKILQAVRSHLEKDYPFAVVDGDGISIMSGDEEGVYAWVTTNYLLGNIGTGSKLATSAVFDLGGGSTQIVFEPTFPPNEEMVDGEHKYELRFGGQDYSLYQFSHLGYGLMEGRNKINQLLVETAIKAGTIKKGDYTPSVALHSPCLPPNVNVTQEKVKLSSKETYVVDFIGPKVASGAQCLSLIHI